MSTYRHWRLWRGRCAMKAFCNAGGPQRTCKRYTDCLPMLEAWRASPMHCLEPSSQRDRVSTMGCSAAKRANTFRKVDLATGVRSRSRAKTLGSTRSALCSGVVLVMLKQQLTSSRANKPSPVFFLAHRWSVVNE
jgi:hypothetical protein